jgi:hypothetical protein
MAEIVFSRKEGESLLISSAQGSLHLVETLKFPDGYIYGYVIGFPKVISAQEMRDRLLKRLGDSHV